MSKQFYSNGKLLLSGEYLILDGAKGLALPTVYGQFLKVESISASKLIWKSLDENDEIWFEVSFSLDELNIAPENIKTFKGSPEEFKITQTLLHILSGAKKLNPQFLGNQMGYEVETKLTFPRDWGLGTSSTLLNNIAQWAKVNAFELLWKTIGGSGYDIACAQHNYPILYALNNTEPTIEELRFNPPFKNQLYFIHLNKKQNSTEGILNYRNLLFNKPKAVQQVSELTNEMIICTDLDYFKELISNHEQILASVLERRTVKESLFPDYEGVLKSLGAWGGDFILAIGDETTPLYFSRKGYSTIVPYSEMIL